MKKLAYNTKTHCIDIVDVTEDNKVLVAKDTYKTIDELTDFKFYDITADNAESILKELSHNCVVFANSSIQNINDTDTVLATIDGKVRFMTTGADVRLAAENGINVYTAVLCPLLSIVKVLDDSHNPGGQYWLIQRGNNQLDVVYKSDENKDWKVGQLVIM